MVVPKAITKPMEDKVLPNPSLMDVIMRSDSKPNKNPTIIEAMINEKTGCTLYFTVAKMIRNITKSKINKFSMFVF
jgi:hypothetical protein